jgi:hypothetical protein
MQLKHKTFQDGTTDKFKARLCGCGNELLGLIADTFSPTVSALSLATVHQLPIINQMETCTLDVTGAFSCQEYPIDAPQLYLQLPANVAALCGFASQRYIYGLPDAGRAYYQAYERHLIDNGYTCPASDPCLFYKVAGSIRAYAFCHVDDILLCSTNSQEVFAFKEMMIKRFKITSNQPVTEYLGISVVELSDGSVKLLQPK